MQHHESSREPDPANIAERLTTIWNKAVQAYERGQFDPLAWADPSDWAFLETIGIRPNEVYDFAEDFVDDGLPTLETFLNIHDIRRDYFQRVQHGVRSPRVIPEASLPPKAESVIGIPWLPRIIAKAKAKLRGELPPEIMYCCGGDRAFLERHGIKAEDFLRFVRDHERDDAAVVDWVVNHSKHG